MPPLPYLLSCAIVAFSDPASALASGGKGMTIVGLPGGQIQSLPDMYVRSMTRWIEIEATDDECDDDHRGMAGGRGGDKEGERMGMARMMAMPGSGGGRDDESESENDDDGIAPRGWVDPTSTSQLWWPLDIPTLQARPSLDVLFRSGYPSYVSAGLDVRVPMPRRRGGSDDGDDGDDDYDVAPSSSSSSWRNHGLNSQPLARQWTTLDIAMERMFHVEGFVVSIESSAGDDDEGGGADDEFDDDVERGRERREKRTNRRYHETLFPSVDVRRAMERIASFVAEMDPSCPLAEGFHIASFPMTREWIDLPRYVGEGERDDRDDIDKDGIGSSPSYGEGDPCYKIVCLGTSEPFASKLLDMDDDILAMSSTSVMEIDVSRTARGGESMYLPGVYRELYLNDDGATG